ncbi:MAG: hypothetical protein Q9213_002845 [Squamulea squamosa]
MQSYSSLSPVDSSLPPHPSMSPDGAAVWQHIRQQYGRMQYRDSPEQEWQSIGGSYKRLNPRDAVEPWNVEQLYFKPEDHSFRARRSKIQNVQPKAGSKEYASVDVEQTKGLATDRDDSSSERVVSRSTDAGTLPLAKAHRNSKSFVGKEIRLALVRGSVMKTTYAFSWPGLIQLLTGSQYLDLGKEANNMDLEEWTSSDKVSPVLDRIAQPPLQKTGHSEWALLKQKRPLSVPHGLPDSHSTPRSLPAAQLPPTSPHEPPARFTQSSPITALPSNSSLIRYTPQELLSHRLKRGIGPALITRLRTDEYDLLRDGVPILTQEPKQDIEGAKGLTETIQAIESALDTLEQEAQEAKLKVVEMQRASKRSEQTAKNARGKAHAVQAKLLDEYSVISESFVEYPLGRRVEEARSQDVEMWKVTQR